MKYEIKGEPTPVVICELSAGESMITEKGSMVWMSPNMEMQTSAGGLGKAFGRMFSGESIFQNIYTAQGGPGTIAFASSFPGAIRAVEITPDRPIVVQKSAFLAATDGVELSVFFQKKLGAGQQLIVDTGNLAVMDTSCSIDIQSVKGVKNMIFGGEGLFNTVVTGPGHITLQTMPISAFAGAISSVLPTKG